MFSDRHFALRLTVSIILIALLLPLNSQAVDAAPASAASARGCMGCSGGGGGSGGSGGQLTAGEIEGLNYMREEEKLARDSYLTLYGKWKLSIFYNISNSEVMHMSRVKDLLDRYGLPDPAAGNSIGVFKNPVLQQLYNELMAQGAQSSTAALQVGVAIEKVDIADLQKYLGLSTKSDIINVFTNLMNGSYCHLRAFNSRLQPQ